VCICVCVCVCVCLSVGVTFSNKEESSICCYANMLIKSQDGAYGIGSCALLGVDSHSWHWWVCIGGCGFPLMALVGVHWWVFIGRCVLVGLYLWVWIPTHGI